MAISKYQLSDVVAVENIFDTTKMFFGQYLCRIEFNLDAARLLYELNGMTFDMVVAFLQDRANILNKYAAMGWTRRESDTSVGDANKLYCVNSILQKGKDKVKVIIRGSNVRVYLAGTDDLYYFIECSAPILTGEFISVHRPANQEAEELLKNNVIFIQNPKFKYKVTVHEGQYDVQSKHRLAKYLNTVDPDNVYLTPGFNEMLTNEKPYVYGAFFVNDPSVTLFTTLIDPTFVNKIYKLEEKRNK